MKFLLNHKSVFRFKSDSQLKQSADSTRAYIELPEADYALKSSTIMKLCYRTNSGSSSSIDFNPKPTANSRLWGPNIKYTVKGEWVEEIVDLSALNYIGGEGVDSCITAKEYFENYMQDQLYSLCLKPYLGNGLAIRREDYFDIAYVAFFPTAEDAKLFTIFGE